MIESDINKCKRYLYNITNHHWSFSHMHELFYLESKYFNESIKKLIEYRNIETIFKYSDNTIVIKPSEIISTIRNEKIDKILTNG